MDKSYIFQYRLSEVSDGLLGIAIKVGSSLQVNKLDNLSL